MGMNIALRRTRPEGDVRCGAVRDRHYNLYPSSIIVVHPATRIRARVLRAAPSATGTPMSIRAIRPESITVETFDPLPLPTQPTGSTENTPANTCIPIETCTC